MTRGGAIESELASRRAAGVGLAAFVVWKTFEWDAPAELWRPGLNRLTLESGDPAIPVGLAPTTAIRADG